MNGYICHGYCANCNNDLFDDNFYPYEDGNVYCKECMEEMMSQKALTTTEEMPKAVVDYYLFGERRNMKPQKYRKKPVVIEALCLTEENITKELLEFAGNNAVLRPQKKGCVAEIKTLEGIMMARPSDYIVRGIRGEFYPVRGDIFLETYEMVEEND